jgi:hypothetical protein
MDKATVFLERAFLWTHIVQCPCSLYQNSRSLEDKRTIAIHLCENGFVPGYEVWTFHGESGTRVVAEYKHDCDMGTLIGWMRCLKLYKQRLLRTLLQRRLRHSSSFSKLRKSHFINTQK